jgi:hypothetical protein
VSWLIDTNVVSELRKRERCDPNVAAWFASIADEEVYLSVLVIGEIRRGVETIRLSAAGATLPAVDGLLAATARVHGLTLATRNVKDVAPTAVPYVNPFEP